MIIKTTIFIFLLSLGIFSQTAKNLTNHSAEDRYPSFSPDGKTILFESDRNGNWDAYSIHLRP